MTSNQLRYQELEETKRSNREKENVAKFKAFEEQRANMAKESVTRRGQDIKAITDSVGNMVSAGKVAAAVL